MAGFETERIIVREYCESDLLPHHLLMSDSKTMYYLQDIMTHSPEESRENLEYAIEAAAKKPRAEVFLAMEEKQTGEYMGSVGYTVVETPPPGKIVHMGYFMLPQYHSKGYMTEAVSGLLHFAFLQDGVYRVNTGCFAENKASERVMQKCGMIKEGEYKNAEWHDGKMKTRVAYRMLKEEFEEKLEENQE